MLEQFLDKGQLRPANASAALITIDHTNFLMQLTDQKSASPS